jgi:hypothetical protein
MRKFCYPARQLPEKPDAVQFLAVQVIEISAMRRQQADVFSEYRLVLKPFYKPVRKEDYLYSQERRRRVFVPGGMGG